MTAYFDDMHRQIRAVDLTCIEAIDQLHHIEKTLVFDCTVAVMLGMPDDLARRIHETILLEGIVTQPSTLPLQDVTDFEHMHEHVRHLDTLCFDLHSLFHEAAEREDYPHHDDPRAPLLRLYAEGEDLREQMGKARKNQAKSIHEPNH